MESLSITRRWIQVGIVAGLVACVTYPLMVFVPMPRLPTLVAAGAFGPALAFASVALYRILALRRDGVGIQIAAISNVVAGALVTCMLIVQLQIRWAEEEGLVEGIEGVADALWQIVLGLDVSFDVFVGIGTLLFGVAMVRNPAFGRVVGVLGAVVGGVFVLGFNAIAFPRLPVQIGLPDPGPISGLWYLLVVIMVIRGRRRLVEEIPSGDLAVETAASRPASEPTIVR